MKNTKLKVLVVTLAVCLLAMGSLSTLAWFTAEDEVTNNFLIADSDDDADEIFSVDVWEKDEDGNIKDSITYPDIQPGDDLYKEVNIENTGYYDQYIRATVTITGADVWFDVYGEIFIDLAEIATDLNSDFETYRVEFDVDKKELIYTLYYNKVLVSDEIVNLFTNVHIPEALTQAQAAALKENAFSINVLAEAVQTANVGDDAIEAFGTIEGAAQKESGNFVTCTTATGAIYGIEKGILNGIPADVSFDFTDDIDDVFTAKQLINSGSLEILGGVVNTDFVQTNGGSVDINNSTLNSGNADNYAFIAKSGAEAVIDNTVINARGGAIGATGGSKVVFNSGSLYVDSPSTSARYCFYAADAGSEIVINGGEFAWDPKDNTKRAYVYASAGTTVTINGGTFGKASDRSGYTAGILGSGTVVIKGGTFGFDPSAWVAEGYEAVKNGATWTVVAK